MAGRRCAFKSRRAHRSSCCPFRHASHGFSRMAWRAVFTFAGGPPANGDLYNPPPFKLVSSVPRTASLLADLAFSETPRFQRIRGWNVDTCSGIRKRKKKKKTTTTTLFSLFRKPRRAIAFTTTTTSLSAIASPSSSPKTNSVAYAHNTYTSVLHPDDVSHARKNSSVKAAPQTQKIQ